MSNRFTPKTEALLVAAGWFPGRKVDWRAEADKYLPEISVPAAAVVVLDEFSGLRIQGTSYLCIGVVYGHVASNDLQPIQNITGLTMYPLAESNEGGGTQILVDTVGRTFWFFESVEFLGETFDVALEFLLARRRQSPLPTPPLDLLPGQWKIRDD